MIRRLAVLLCLALLPSLAGAAVIEYKAPPGVAPIGGSFVANCVPYASSTTTLLCTPATSDGTNITLASGQLIFSNQTLTTTVAPAISITRTWNDSGTSHRLIYGNVTDTASAAASTLLDLQVGSASKFSVTKAGSVTAGSHLIATADVRAGASAAVEFSTRSAWRSPFDGQLDALNNANTANAGIRQSRIVEVVTTTKSPSATENGEIYTNTGDTDGSTITLLNDPTIGSQYCVAVDAAQTVTVAPSAGESILQAGTAYTTSCTNNARGSMACFVAITGGSGALWSFLSTGTWTCS